MSTQVSQPSQAAQARLGVDLVNRFKLIERDQGRQAAVLWSVGLPQADWLALMEAKRTGLKA